MNERCLVLIDGSNFYFKLKSLRINQTLKLDFTKLVKFIVKNKKLIEVRYYVGRVRQDGTKRTNDLLANQQKLFAALRKHHVKYVLGYLLKSNGKYHEKGVDVHMAVDMLEAAYENICDRIVLISSDTDLEPAIRKVRAKNKIVEYVGFSHQPSVGMVSFCTESTLLKREDLEPLITPI